MSKLRIAIIGNGGICQGSHIENYCEDERVEVVAFCDIIEERAVALKNEYYPNADVYTDYKELLKDESIDAVDICTPNYLHSIIAVDALEKGIINYSTCIDDTPFTFEQYISSNGKIKYTAWPVNSPKTYKGLTVPMPLR